MLVGFGHRRGVERWRCRGCLGGRSGAQPESTNIIVMGAIHTNCDPAVLMVVEPRHMARRVDGSPRESNIGSQVRRRRALEAAWLTPTSPLDGPMDPAPTEPVGASDTTVSASAGGRLGYNWERFSNQAAFLALHFSESNQAASVHKFHVQK